MRTAIVIGWLLLTLGCVADASSAECPAIAPMSTWRELSAPHRIWPHDGAIYYSFPVSGCSRAHLVVVDMRSGKWRLRPVIAGSTSTASAVAVKENASVVINGGYFNLKAGAGQSASFVISGGVIVADPKDNAVLVNNAKLVPFMDRILNRTELRVLKTREGRVKIQIAKHNDAVTANCRLIDSLQAGPRLLPKLDASEEAFIRREADGTIADSINVKKCAARTAFGITADGYAMLLCVSGKGQDPESVGLTLLELQNIMKNLGCTEALNLDGGASTTMFVRLTPTTSSLKDIFTPPGTVVVGKSPETMVKSLLLLEPVDALHQ